MARAQFQILVIPFRENEGKFEFAVFKRSDSGEWQGIAGGGEGDESIMDSAKREALEEANIPCHLPFYRLQAIASIPVCHFEARKYWPDDLYVIPEYSFGVDCTGHDIIISKEHIEIKWGTYDETIKLMTWESNKTALWELNERLNKNNRCWL